MDGTNKYSQFNRPKKAKFTGNILILGCGNLTQHTLPLLFKHLAIEYSQITIMDFAKKKNRIRTELNKGMNYIQICLNKKNCQKILKEHLKKQDIFIDFSGNFDVQSRINWCEQHGVLFLDTDINRWKNLTTLLDNPTDKTLYSEQRELFALAKAEQSKPQTGIIDSGAHPIIISHFTKEALTDMTNTIMKHKPAAPEKEKICYMMLVRHGETAWNVQKKRQGWTDIPLNDEGRKQARILGEKLSEIPIKAVYASALSRAVETAEIVSKHHKNSSVIPDPSLRFYRKTFRPWNFLLPKAYKKKRMFQEIVTDSIAYFRNLAQEHAGDTVVVVTHRKAIKHLLGALGEAPFDLENGGFICLASDGTNLWIEHQKNR